MKKVLFDANVVLDMWLEREGLFESSSKAIDFAIKKRVVGFIPATSVPVIFYRAEKQKNRFEAEKLLRTLISYIGVAAADEKTVSDALNAGFDDFEDALVYSIAANNRLDYIVTRDKKGFKNARNLPVLTPEEFVGMFL